MATTQSGDRRTKTIHPPLGLARTLREHARWWFVTACLLAFMTGGLGLWSVIGYGSVSNGIAYLSGRSLLIDEEVIDLGVVRPNARARAAVVVRNLGRAEVRLLGSRSSCTCTVLAGLPRLLPPRSAARFEVEVRVPDRAMSVDSAVEIFADHPTIRSVSTRIIATVEASP